MLGRDFESEMPIWSGDAAAAQVSPVEMKIAQVDRIWRRIGEEQEPGLVPLPATLFRPLYTVPCPKCVQQSQR